MQSQLGIHPYARPAGLFKITSLSSMHGPIGGGGGVVLGIGEVVAVDGGPAGVGISNCYEK